MIASGTALTFRSSGIESIIVDLVNRESTSASTPLRGKVPSTVTKRRSSQLLAMIESLRAQAENTNIAIQTRSNPAMTNCRWQVTVLDLS